MEGCLGVEVLGTVFTTRASTSTTLGLALSEIYALVLLLTKEEDVAIC